MVPAAYQGIGGILEVEPILTALFVICLGGGTLSLHGQVLLL